MSLAHQHQEIYSYKDYLTWSDNERWEIIEGVPYNMSPAPSRKHQDVLRELGIVIANYLKDATCTVYFAPFDVRLSKSQNEEDVTNVVQPDIAVICDESKLDDRGCNGAPDFIIEIESPSSITHDSIHKFNLYERYGVKEYWIVDPLGGGIMTFILGEDGRYGRPQSYMPDKVINCHILKGLSIDLNEIFPFEEKVSNSPKQTSSAS